jgi:hypothetical protein
VLASGVVDPAWTANGTPLCNAVSDQEVEPLGYVPPIEFEEVYYRQNGLPHENGFAGSIQSHDRASA